MKILAYLLIGRAEFPTMKRFLANGPSALFTILLLCQAHAVCSAEPPPAFVLEWGGLQDPIAIVASPANEIYVLDAGCQCVKKFDVDLGEVMQEAQALAAQVEAAHASAQSPVA